MQFYTGSFWHPVQYLVGWYNRTTWPEVPIGLGNSKSPESHEISWKWRVSPKIQLQILNNLPLPENQLPFTHKPKSPISSHPQIKPHLQPLRLLRCCCLACLHCTPAMLGKAGDCWVVWEGRFVLGLIIIRFAFLILFQWKMHKNDTPAIRLPFPIENGISDLQSVRSIFLGGEATARKQDWHQIHPWKFMADNEQIPSKVKRKIIWTIHLLFLETKPFIFQGGRKTDDLQHLRPSLETTPGFQRRVGLLGGDFAQCPSHDWCPSKTGIPTKKTQGATSDTACKPPINH